MKFEFRRFGIWLLIALILLGILGWKWSGSRAQSPVTSEESTLVSEEPANPDQEALPPEPTTPKDAMPPTNPAAKSLTNVLPQMPDLERIRQEVREDPHGTPPSLVQFATEVSDRLEEIHGDRQAESEFLRELLACSLPENPNSRPSSLQAFCFSTAKEMAEEIPELQGEVDAAESQLDPETMKLINSYLSE